MTGRGDRPADSFNRPGRRWLPALLALLLAAGGPVTGEETDWDDWNDDPWDGEIPAFSLHGFVEGAAGHRLQSDRAVDDDFTLGEARLHLEGRYEAGRASWRFKLEGLADGVAGEVEADLREALVSFPVGGRTDIRLGRQVLTWGTGDLVFLNDLFPKDWVSFLIGRDDEYLKAPSDAVRASWYGKRFNFEAVWTPRFEPDVFVDGRRLSFFDPAAGRIVAAPPRLVAARPSRSLRNGELAVRAHGMAGAHEWAVYGYRGFFGQPTAFDSETGQFTFARLNSVGASMRGPAAGGIYNLETAWYDSARNRDGDDPGRPNSEWRFLAGFEREVIPDLTIAGQYYLEWIQDHDALAAAWPFDPAHMPDERRHLLTLRLTRQWMRDNLIVGIMNFYSPSDDDYFLRPTLQYRFTDAFRINAGIHLFGGNRPSTFYGQFEDNSSAYVRLRYSF